MKKTCGLTRVSSMTVNRFRDGEFAEVNKVGNPLEDASVNVRREDEWQEIWPSVDIPDSGALQYHIAARLDDTHSQGDPVTTIPDHANGFDLSGGSPTFEADVLNGEPVYRFDGIDDELEHDDATISQPYTVFAVVKGGDTNDEEAIWSSHSGTAGSDRAALDIRYGDDEYLLFAGETVSGGTPDTNYHIVTSVVDGSNSLVRVDGTEITSGDAGNFDLDGLMVGDTYTTVDRHLDGDLAELPLYPDRRTSQQIDDVEGALSDIYGISLA